jgi:hypothetical protein
MSARIPIKPKIYEPAPVQAELPMRVPPSIPPTTELVTKAQLIAKHPHLLSLNRVAWALRYRAVNGLSDLRLPVRGVTDSRTLVPRVTAVRGAVESAGRCREMQEASRADRFRAGGLRSKLCAMRLRETLKRVASCGLLFETAALSCAAQVPGRIRVRGWMS